MIQRLHETKYSLQILNLLFHISSNSRTETKEAK